MSYDKKLFNEAINQINFDVSTPSKDDVLRVLNMKEVKVIILGQDPYPTKGVANGRAFAVNKDIKIPQSLNNIFKEIEDTFGEVKTDRTLQSWEDQGVMLLNTSLTTKINNSNAHKSIWKNFTLDLIQRLDKENVIWVLWGNEAKAYKKYIINSKYIIEDAHPSPLSVSKRKGDTFSKLSNLINIKW